MSNQRSPNWADYGNLFANAVQVGQLAAVQGKLNELAQIEAARENREKFENALRQLVFNLERGATILRSEFLERAPLGVAAAAGVLQEVVKGFGLGPAIFQQFVDKDRVESFLRGLSKLGEDSAALLDETDKEEVERLARLGAHSGDLERLITAREAKWKLEDTEWELRELSGLGSKKTSWLFVLLGALALTLSAFLTAPGSGVISDLRILLGIAAAGLGIFAVVRLSESSPELVELRKSRDSLRAKLMKHEDYLRVCAIFGEDLPIEEYKRVRREIDAFFERAYRHDKNGKPLTSSLWEMVFPEGFSPS